MTSRGIRVKFDINVRCFFCSNSLSLPELTVSFFSRTRKRSSSRPNKDAFLCKTSAMDRTSECMAYLNWPTRTDTSKPMVSCQSENSIKWRITFWNAWTPACTLRKDATILSPLGSSRPLKERAKNFSFLKRKHQHQSVSIRVTALINVPPTMRCFARKYDVQNRHLTLNYSRNIDFASEPSEPQP